ncbi:MAG: hypothetical protein PHD54_01945 [Desulfuromonadaceae bacterium]|nr:hypothetical protein [Desulfuromonadaceae bacterium]
MSSPLTKITIILSFLSATSISALAAAEGRNNESEIVVWGFLALCAVIIIAQIAPLIHNLKKQGKMAAEQTKSVKSEQMQ